MPEARDNLRAARRKIIVESERLGIDLSEERRRYGSNTRALIAAANKLINNATPRTSSDQLIVDAPPAGAFDGVNVTFTLSQPVAGQNVGVTHHRAALNITLSLARTTQDPPPADAFLFDVNNPTTIVLGTAPQVDDMIVATFKTR